jgi:hypothetical protein
VSGRHFVFCVRSAIPQGGGIVAGERVGATNVSILVRRVGGVKKTGGKREDVVAAKPTNAWEAPWDGPFMNGEFF